MSALTAWNDDADLAAAGYVLAPEGRYVDEAHGIDWAVILWVCPVCLTRRAAPGPGQSPHCVLHGRMVPVLTHPAHRTATHDDEGTGR